MKLRKIFVLVVLVIALLPLFANQKMSVIAKSKFKGAKIHMSGGRSEKAIKGFKQVLEMHPENIESSRFIANIYYDKEKEYELALEYYELTISNIDNEIKSLKVQIAKNPDDAKDFREEIESYNADKEDIAKYKKSCWSRLFNTGLTLYKKEKFKLAYAEFEELYKIDNSQKKISTMLARISKKLEKNEDVIKYYTQVTMLDSNDVEASKELALYYYLNEDYELAITWYNKTVNLEPENSDHLNNLAVVYNKLGKTEEEIATYEKIVKFETENKIAIGNIGNYYAKQNNNEKAVEYFIMLLNLEENDANFNIVCTYLARLQRFKELAKYSKKWLTISPENSTAKQMYNYSKDK
ncbi:MAG: tetratricopeptide repeat protein [Candidatus Cloacimonadota bacterium]|nr:tetratricopeptide repeat protein [Candidatus Cloacimonadota bacterium]